MASFFYLGKYNYNVQTCHLENGSKELIGEGAKVPD
jgi:hypothetical protein